VGTADGVLELLEVQPPAGARWPPPTSCEVARCEARRGLQARQGPLSEDAITKLDLAEYYAAVAPAMVPLIHGRPLNLQRYPDGLGGKALFTQQAPKHFPDWIARATVPKKDGTVDHAVVERADTLVYLAGQACLTVHAWTSRRDRLARPDRLVIDFDPQIDDFDAIRDAARLCGDLYRECGLEPFAMVTGSRGIHVVARCAARASTPTSARWPARSPPSWSGAIPIG
jgi:DNA ligase D-like protein (predicted polymerase)